LEAKLAELDDESLPYFIARKLCEKKEKFYLFGEFCFLTFLVLVGTSLSIN